VCQVHEVLRGDPEPMENLLELGLLVAMVTGIPIHGRPPSVWVLLTGSEEINLFVFPSIDAMPSSMLFAVTGTTRKVGIFNTIIDTSLITKEWSTIISYDELDFAEMIIALVPAHSLPPASMTPKEKPFPSFGTPEDDKEGLAFAGPPF
jgi:hypothetical protein